MLVTIQTLPPDGGEIDFSFQADVPEIPRAGDYLSIFRDRVTGTEDFIVRRTRWDLSVTSDGDEPATVKAIFVDCEYALGYLPSESHKTTCARLEAKGKKVKAFSDAY